RGWGRRPCWRERERAGPTPAGIRGPLGRRPPADRGSLERRRSVFLVRLDRGLARWQATLAPYRGIRIVVVHESCPYFPRRFGLEIVAAVGPAARVPPPPASRAALTPPMNRAQDGGIIAERNSDPAPGQPHHVRQGKPQEG